MTEKQRERESYRLKTFIQGSLFVRSMSAHSLQVQLFPSWVEPPRDVPRPLSCVIPSRTRNASYCHLRLWGLSLSLEIWCRYLLAEKEPRRSSRQRQRKREREREREREGEGGRGTKICIEVAECEWERSFIHGPVNVSCAILSWHLNDSWLNREDEWGFFLFCDKGLSIKDVTTDLTF